MLDNIKKIIKWLFKITITVIVSIILTPHVQSLLQSIPTQGIIHTIITDVYFYIGNVF